MKSIYLWKVVSDTEVAASYAVSDKLIHDTL